MEQIDMAVRLRPSFTLQWLQFPRQVEIGSRKGSHNSRAPAITATGGRASTAIRATPVTAYIITGGKYGGR